MKIIMLLELKVHVMLQGINLKALYLSQGRFMISKIAKTQDLNN